MAENEYLISDIPDFLRRLRKQHGLTLKQASERDGMSLSYLSDIERGRTVPTLETLNKIIQGYGLVLTLQAKRTPDRLPPVDEFTVVVSLHFEGWGKPSPVRDSDIEIDPYEIGQE